MNECRSIVHFLAAESKHQQALPANGSNRQWRPKLKRGCSQYEPWPLEKGCGPPPPVVYLFLLSLGEPELHSENKHLYLRLSLWLTVYFDPCTDLSLAREQTQTRETAEPME